MLPISKRRLSPLAEAPPLDSLCVAESLPLPARVVPRDACVLRRPAKRMRAETAELLELQFLSCVFSGKQAEHIVKKQYSDMDEYFSAMSAMILDEAKGMLSEMQKGTKRIPCKTALTSTRSYSLMEFNIPENVDVETWSVLLAEPRDSPPFPVVVRHNASGEPMGVIAQKEGETGPDFDAWLYYPSSVYLGDLWRQWQVCKTSLKEGPVLRAILGQDVCSAAERAQTSTFNESGLNSSQAQALNMCLSGAQCLHCIQGPPGTGKSKTILNFIDFLARAAKDASSEDLFLVASMTNKACQHLALKFREAPESRSIPVALAGNMKKLPADALLQNIFVHRMGSHFANQVCEKGAHLRDKVAKWMKAWAPDTYAGAEEELLGASDSFSLEKVLQDLDRSLQKELLGRARILFATLSTLASPRIREEATRSGQRQVKWVIVDEAGQAVEAQMLPVLVWQPERALLVGDTKQLTATTSQLGRDVGYSRSLMSRLEELGMVPHMLNIQYRMLPPISCFPARHFYSGKLHDSQVWKGTDPGAMLSDWLSKKCPMKSESVPAYAFLNMSGTERQAGASCANHQEAEFCVHLASSLLRGSQSSGEERKGLERPKCIIITFYAGQKEALEQLKLQFPAAHRPEVHTVDSFQGSEAEQVVISFVRSNFSGRTGFLSDYRRLNVALTRAQRSLFLVGDLTFMKSTESDLAVLARDAESRGVVAEAEQVYRCMLPEIYAAPAVTLVPCSAGQNPVKLTPNLTSQMSTSEKIDAPLSALI